MEIDRTVTRRHWLAGGFVLALGAALRLLGIRGEIILDDEWHALNMVQDHGFATIFGSFGHADHSIPVTLLYELTSRTVGLGELGMRWPALVAGIATVAVVPMVLRPWLRPGEQVLTAALLAVSPLLIFYSRLARPYGLLALLVSLAVVMAWRWWRERRPVHGAVWFCCAVPAAWLHPLSLVVTFAPFAWIGTAALVAGLRRGAWGPLARVVLLAASALLAAAALLAVPVLNDFSSLLIKSGQDRPDLRTAWGLLSLFAGSGQPVVIAAIFALALLGFFQLRFRSRSFASYLALVSVLSAAVILATGAEWIHQSIVPARYLVGLLPLVLALVAIGMLAALRTIAELAAAPRAAIPVGAALTWLILVAAGPLPDWELGRSQFTHHQAYQFDYRSDRNPYVALFEDYRVPDFYAEIARRHPRGEALVVEAPWHLESFWNPLHLHQRVHGQRVRIGFLNGLCADHFYGELRAAAEGLEFENFVQVAELLDGGTGPGYLVLRDGYPADARALPVRFDECRRKIGERLGEPWRRTPNAVVYRLPGTD